MINKFIKENDDLIIKIFKLVFQGNFGGGLGEFLTLFNKAIAFFVFYRTSLTLCPIFESLFLLFLRFYILLLSAELCLTGISFIYEFVLD
jgi:hypothetical protein